MNMSQDIESTIDGTAIEIIDEEVQEIEQEAERIILSVLNLASRLDVSILKAFRRGLLDVPFCIHPDNRNECSTFIDQRGFLRWARTGGMDVSTRFDNVSPSFGASSQLLAGLKYMRRKYDAGPRLSHVPE